jgi:hypothetical protein
MRKLPACITIVLFAVVFSSSIQAYPSDGSVEADSIGQVMHPGIYYVTMGPEADPQLKVSLLTSRGIYDIFIEEIRYDDIEGIPHHTGSFHLSDQDIMGILDCQSLVHLEFVEWIDSATFALKISYEELNCIVEYPGDRSFSITEQGVSE